MLKKILLTVVAVVVLLAAVIATRPSEFQVKRAVVMAAPPSVAFAQVADFARWSEWSPWAKLDPAMKTTLSGAPAAAGHAYAWAGNDKVGEGRMTILSTQPGERVEIRLEFLKPWAATNLTTFTFAPEDAGTRVTWTMSGHANFMMKAICLFGDMDKMVGGDFERGLAAMKGVAEVEAAKAPTGAASAAATP